MNLSASQCSSGCESGWTLYLDQSSLSKNKCHSFGRIVEEEYTGKGGRGGDHEDEEEEEDLSMVSDASSGPRHYCEDDEEYCFDENGCLCSPSLVSELAKKSEKKKKKLKEHGGNLDDTASSTVLGFSKKNISFSNKEASMEHALGFSQGFSATHLKSSLAGKRASGEKSGGVQGRKWE